MPGWWRAALLVLLLAPTGLRAADTNAVLEGWLAAQTKLTNWSARFVQTRWFKALQQPLVSTGRVWFAKPNHFRWELGVPPQTIAVRDAGRLEVIYPRLKRVEHYPLDAAGSGPLGEALGLLDAGFPRDRGDFEARFRLRSLQSSNGAWLLELQPASAAARRLMPAIHLTLAATNYTLLANELQFADGARMRSDFREAVWNTNLPDDLFRPVVAPDFTVTQPLSP